MPTTLTLRGFVLNYKTKKETEEEREDREEKEIFKPDGH